jgi:protein JBTS26
MTLPIVNNLFESTDTRFRLFDGEHVTCDDHHMWLCPYRQKERVRIMISLSVSKKLHGLRIWNYNKSLEDTYRGVSRSVIIVAIGFD